MELIFYSVLGALLALVGERIINKKIESIEFAEEVDEMIEAVIRGIREEVPMAGAFLRGAIEEKLKNVGRKKIEDRLPSIKKKIQRRLIPHYGRVMFVGALMGTCVGWLVRL